MWDVSESAEFRAASTTAFLRKIAKDNLALRGAFKLVGFARRNGCEVTFAGVKFSALSPIEGNLARERVQGHQAPTGETAKKRASGAQRRDPGGSHPRADRQPAADAAKGSPRSHSPSRTLSRAHGKQPWGPISERRWKAPKAKRFGVKKQMQKLQASARICVRLLRWLRRARTTASDKTEARAHSLAAAEAVATRVSARISSGCGDRMADAMTDETPAQSARKRAISPSAPIPCREPIGEG